jgi:hypothetical protein
MEIIKNALLALFFSTGFFHLLFSISIRSDSPFLTTKDCLEANSAIGWEVHSLSIPSFPNAYNPSIVAWEGEFLLFFRYDEKREHLFNSKKFEALTYIGVARLSKDLKKIGPVKILNLMSSYAEDPRAILWKGKVGIFYNDLTFGESLERKMKVAVLDPKKLEIDAIYPLPSAKKGTEKNWTPLIFEEKGDELGFVYSFDDLSLYKIDFIDDEVAVSSLGYNRLKNFPLDWVRRYGLLRGGAPAFFAEKRYWAFFHSMHKVKKPVDADKFLKEYYYLPGLVTFVVSPSIEMLEISLYPILYDGAFDTVKTRCFEKNVIYPSGCVYDPESREVILTVGENDSGIKILKTKLDRLKSSLKKVSKCAI